MTTIRRVVLLHTAGPYPGLRQIIGLFEGADTAPSPEVLPAPGTGMALTMWPDGRHARALRLKATPKFVLYQERPVEAPAKAVA